MLRFAIASLALAVGVAAAAAQDMKSPRIAPTRVDWDAVAVELGAPDPAKSAVVVPDLMAKLNRATGERFANIAASPVPVLLPFDTAAFLRDRTAVPETAAASANAPADNYLLGFDSVPFFYPDRQATTPLSSRARKKGANWESASPMRSTSTLAGQPCCMKWMSRGA